MRKALLFLFVASVALAQDSGLSQRPAASGGGGAAFSGGTVTSAVLGPTGCAAPAFSFTSDTNAGLCLTAVNSVALSNGTLGFDNTSGFAAYTGAAEMAFYDGGFLGTKVRAQDGIIYFDVDGSTVGAFTPTLMSFGGLRLSIGEGSVSQAGVYFFTDENTGFWHPGFEQIGVAVDGVNRFMFTTSGPDFVDPGTKPTCDSSKRGIVFLNEGGAGVADTFEVCSKDAADVYAWRTLIP
jgi:hypothetical protein